MFHSCLCDETTVNRSLLISVIPYEIVAERITLEELYDEIVWSFQAAELGFHPRFDSSGKRLEGWRGEVAGRRLAGDWNLSFAWMEADWKYSKDAWRCVIFIWTATLLKRSALV